jgi:hypothetical protein
VGRVFRIFFSEQSVGQGHHRLNIKKFVNTKAILRLICGSSATAWFYLRQAELIC